MAAIGAVVPGLVLLSYSIGASARVTHGFTMYYTYSRMVLEGVPFERAFSPSEFNERIRSYGIEGIDDVPNNPPTTALVLLPVAWLPPVQAKVAWTALSVLFFGIGLVLMLRAYSVAAGDLVMRAVLGLAFLWRPVYEGIALGQIYAFLFLLLMVAGWGLVRSRPVTAGFTIGVTFLSKGYGSIPAIWLFLRGHRTAALAFVVTVISIAAGTLPILHAESWQRFARESVLGMGQHPADAHVAFQTINSLLFHLFTYDPRWIQHPVVVLPAGLVRATSYLLNLGIVVAVLIASRSTPHLSRGGDPVRAGRDTMLAFAATLAVSVVTAPLAEEYHYILFFPLVAGLLVHFCDRGEVGPPWSAVHVIFAFSVLILAAPLPYKDLQESSFPLILLAYPKVYAGLAVLGCYVARMRTTGLRPS